MAGWEDAQRERMMGNATGDKLTLSGGGAGSVVELARLRPLASTLMAEAEADAAAAAKGDPEGAD